MLQQDHAFMAKALELADRARQVGEVPVGAVVVFNDQIIGKGYNCPIGRHDPTAHAEIVAIRQAALFLENYRMPGTTLYVTLEPCAMCVGAIIHARIKRLVYAAPEPRAGAVCSAFNLAESKIFNHKLQIESGIMAVDSSQLLKEFFTERRNSVKQ